MEICCSYSLTPTLDKTDIGQNGVLLFNSLAFLLQPAIGWAADRSQAPRFVATTGGLLIFSAILFSDVAPWPAIALLGLGNACFHVGAGAMCIGLSRGRVAGLGLFVGPGAVGLMIGVGLARTPMPFAAVGVGALTLPIIGCLWYVDTQSEERMRRRTTRSAPKAKFWCVVVVGLILTCIAIRSFVSMGLGFSWNTSATTALAIALALAAGKIGGGFLADRFGWIVASVSALALSVPASYFGLTNAGFGLIGVALFQAPMAVTLGALVRIFPTRPGFSFGIASAAIFGGAFLLTGDHPQWLLSIGTLSLLSLIAAGMLVLGLKWIRSPNESGNTVIS